MKLKDESRKIAKEKKLLNTVQAAKYLGYGEAALKKWRADGKGPAYYKGKGGMVFYDRADLDKFKTKSTLVRVEPRASTRTA
jgi:hypothetical protein